MKRIAALVFICSLTVVGSTQSCARQYLSMAGAKTGRVTQISEIREKVLVGLRFDM